VVDVERLVTVVELDERDPSGHSIWAHLYAELSTGERRRLLDDRGWSGSAEIADEGLASIENTARMVVGPDGPGPGETDEQMQSRYWAWMERTLRGTGIRGEAAELTALPHDVEVGEHLGRRLATTP
jgi:ADP-ribose pyrophosphatase YjhB (NUDIX family)